MDFRLTEEQELLRRSVREFAETEIRPHVREWDEAQHFPSEIVPTLASLGLMGIQVPEQYGGAGMSAINYCICIEELARIDAAISLSVAAHNGLCSSHISLFGNEAQGLPPDYETECDVLVKMPMLGKAASLNVAVATAVMAYEVLNQKRRSGKGQG